MAQRKEGNLLPKSFYAKETLWVAKNLLGQYFYRRDPDTKTLTRFKIIETEAYITETDPACHGYQRMTPRSAIFYEEPGTAYVYFTYGMHHCMNIVTEPKGTGGAVLIRALEPPEGSNLRTHGPGRLTKALGITKDKHNQMPLTTQQSELFLTQGDDLPTESQIVQTTRIGISKAQDFPWRFYIKDNPHVSVKASNKGKRKKPRKARA